MTKHSIRINVPALARVEGEGALDLEIRNGAIRQLQLRIYEPPRFFEKFLEGREFSDIPDIVARICGICPVAYQMSAVQAIESIFSTEVTPWIRDMRRVMYCGEWIQSHSLHIHMLAAPDFLGVNNVTEIAQQDPEMVNRGLRLQALGNRLIALFGGRSVHPIGVRVGGFSQAPDPQTVAELAKDLHAAIPAAEQLLAWVATLDLASASQDYTYVAMRDEFDYPINTGHLVSNTGLELDIEDFESRFQEQQIPHSTALHCALDGQAYLVGPLARLNLNLDRLPSHVRELVDATKIEFPSLNMFHSIVARAVEILLALHEARSILNRYVPTQEPYVEVTPRAGVGFGCTEAPRGILWHRYELDDRGHVVSARIVPPTSQNQARIEADLRQSINSFGLERAEADIRELGEKVIRNYDPCISCATHFLKLNLRRDARHVTKSPPIQLRMDPQAEAGKKIWVIGVGSPYGADSLGLDVISYLERNEVLSECENLQLMTMDRPGMSLLELVKTTDYLILVDAMNSVIDTDQVLKIDVSSIAENELMLSSHDININDVISVAKALGMALDHVQLLGLVLPADSVQTWSDTDIVRVADEVIAAVSLLNQRMNADRCR